MVTYDVSAARITNVTMNPPPSRIRALFLDLDGTLVGASNTVSPRVCEALAAARARGCELVLCTGRSRITAEPIADQIGWKGYAIVSNGAVVMHFGTREVLCTNRIPRRTALQAVRLLLDAGCGPEVYEDTFRGARVLFHPDHPPHQWSKGRHTPWPALASELPYDPICVSAFGEEALLRPVAERLQQNPLPGTYVEQAGTHLVWCLEVHHRGSGKCNGLRLVTGRLGIAPEAILAIGDHINDMEMLRFAGVGVAMGNALPEVKAAADWVTAPLSEDGVALAIERFVLHL